jgi:hypothetical protein
MAKKCLCNSPVPKFDGTCLTCGKLLNWDRKIDSENPAFDEVSASMAPTKSSKKLSSNSDLSTQQLFCTNCGNEVQALANFCGLCGHSIQVQSETKQNSYGKTSELSISSKEITEVLNHANTVADEYQDKASLRKPLKSFMNTGFGKERIEESWSQKAIARFEGSAKENSILPREICFAEDTVLFITENNLFSKGTATALRKSEIQFIEVSLLQSNLGLGLAQRTDLYWKLNFVTKWAGIPSDRKEKGLAMAYADSTWNFKEGEISFYLPLGNSNYQVEKYEEVYSEKLDTVAAFYPVKFSNLVVTTNRSVGLFIGAGFWREVGD